MTERSSHSEQLDEKAGLSKGGLYLLVVDDSREFQKALRAAARFSNSHGATPALLYAMDNPDFQSWGSVEEQIMAEQRRNGEKALKEAADFLYEEFGLYSSFYIERGLVRDILVEIIEGEDDIKALILGAGAQASNPLTSYFSGKGLSHLKVPLFVIPDV